MAIHTLTDATIWVNEIDLTSFSNQVSLEHSADTVDDSVFGNSTRTFIGGLKRASASISGFQDGATNVSLEPLVGAADTVVSAAPTSTDGEQGFFWRGVIQDFSVLSGSIGEMNSFTLQMDVSSGDLVHGEVLIPKQTLSSSGTGTGQQLGSVSSTQSVYGALHVFSGTASTLDVIVESDDNGSFSSDTDRITFTQATGATSQFASAAGAITDDWWRVRYTIGGGDWSFAVTVGIL